MAASASTNCLNVHKIEIFFCFDFEICNISLLVMSKYILRFCKTKIFDWASIGGGTIFLRNLKTTRNEKIFELGQKFFKFFSFMNPLYEPILVFQKFDPLTVSGMTLCVDLGPKCQKLFCLF
jgi:hypothetical protein